MIDFVYTRGSQHNCITGLIFLLPFLKGPQSCSWQTHSILPSFPPMFLVTFLFCQLHSFPAVPFKNLPPSQNFSPFQLNLYPSKNFAFSKNCFALKNGVKLDNSKKGSKGLPSGPHAALRPSVGHPCLYTRFNIVNLDCYKNSSSCKTC